MLGYFINFVIFIIPSLLYLIWCEFSDVKLDKDEERDAKLKSLKEKLMKSIRELVQIKDEDGVVVSLKPNTAAAQQFVQGQDPAVKSKLKVTGS